MKKAKGSKVGGINLDKISIPDNLHSCYNLGEKRGGT